MKKTKFLSLLMTAMTLIACNKENPFTPELSVSSTSDIQVSSEQKTAHLNVTANVSWTASSNASWVTLNPASKTITDKTSNTTDVTITITENQTWDARTAAITIKAEGCNDIVINVKQEAKAFVPSFEVVDQNGNKITSAITAESSSSEISLIVKSNKNWSVSTNAAWITASPIGKQITGKDIDISTLKLNIAANIGDARTANVTVKAEGMNDVVITVNQKAAVSIKIEVSDITYNGAKVKWTPSDDNVYCMYSIASKGYYSKFKSDQEVFQDDYDYYTEEVYPEYAEDYSLEEFLFGLLTVKGERTRSFAPELDPETDYVIYAYVMNNDGGGKASLGSKVFTFEFSTPKQPDYKGELVLGDYLMEDQTALDQPSSNVFTLESADMGETNYYVKRLGFVGDSFSWIATYDKSAHTLTVNGLAAGYEEQGCLFQKILWQISDYFSGYWSGSNTEGKASLVFSVDPATKKINGLASAGIGLFAAEYTGSGYEIAGFFRRFLKDGTTIAYQTPATTANNISRKVSHINATKLLLKNREAKMSIIP